LPFDILSFNILSFDILSFDILSFDKKTWHPQNAHDGVFPVNPTPVAAVLPASGPADDIPPPIRTASPALSPLPNDPLFVENVLDHSIFRHEAEKFRSSGSGNVVRFETD
jgi:hypothetical protein